MRLAVIIIAVLLNFLNALSFSIDKPALHVVTARANNNNYSIVLRNNNDTPLKLKAYAQDWEYGADRKAKNFLPAGTSKYSCADWIKINDQTFTVPANGRKEFYFELKTPGNVTGGHYAVLFFETQLPRKDNKGLSYGARLGSIIYQETKEYTETKLEITDKKLSVAGGKTYYKVNVKNTGNAWNSAAAHISLVKNGEVADQQKLGPLNLLPGDEQEFAGSFNSSNSEVLITIEDAGDNLYTDRLGSGSAVADKPVQIEKQVTPAEQAEFTVNDFMVYYNDKNKELGVQLLAVSSVSQRVMPVVKIFTKTGKQNILKRVKTLEFMERGLQPGQQEKFFLTWPAGDALAPGKYTVELTIETVNGRVARTKDLII